MQTSKRANIQTRKRAKKDTMANALGQIRAKANIIADYARADTMTVCAKADAIKESATGNLQRRICKRESANEEKC